jgi:hypothetical protein
MPELGEASSTRGKLTRKLAWTALYGGIGALASMAARRAASGIWRKTTGEEPPAKT